VCSEAESQFKERLNIYTQYDFICLCRIVHVLSGDIRDKATDI